MTTILLLTRPRAQADRFAALCGSRFGTQVDIVVSPILEVEHRPLRIPLPPEAHLIFTSEQAVPAAGAASGRTAYCVGDRTADVARKAGFRAISAGGAAPDLIACILKERPIVPLVYLHGAQIRSDIAAALRAEGLRATSQVVYAQIQKPLSHQAQNAIRADTPILLPVFSPRSAELLSQNVQSARAPLFVAAFSKSVADAWSGPAKQLTIAAHPTVEPMLDAIETLLTDTLP